MDGALKPTAEQPTHGAGGDDPTAAVPSIDHLLRLVDAELSDSTRETGKTGRSPWVLVVAVSGLLWLLATDKELPSANPRNVLVTAFGVAALAELLGGLRTLNVSTSGAGTPGRFRACSRQLGPSRLHMFALCCWQAGMAIVAWHLRGDLGSLAFAPLALYALFTLLVGLTLLVSLTPLHMSAAPPRNRVLLRLLTTVALIAPAIAAVAVGRYAVDRFATISQVDIRVAGIIAAIAQLLLYLSMEVSTPPLLAELRSVRRNLVLGNLSPQEATSQIEIALDGMRADHVLQTELHELLHVMDQRRAGVRRLRSLSFAADAMIRSGALSEARDLLEQGAHQVRRILEYREPMREALDRFETRAKRLIAMEPNCTPDIDNVVQEVSRGMDLLEKEIGAAQEISDTLGRTLGGLLPPRGLSAPGVPGLGPKPGGC